MRWSVQYFIHLDNIWMLEKTKNSNLTFDLFFKELKGKNNEKSKMEIETFVCIFKSFNCLRFIIFTATWSLEISWIATLIKNKLH